MPNNLYINPNAFKDNSIPKSKIKNSGIVNITYNELKTLRNNNELEKGTLYRITDYVTTTRQENTTSAGHQFDIIVLALDNSHLSEEAWATQHEGDTYFANNNLDAWKIWYCLDNDADRFKWACYKIEATLVTMTGIYKRNTEIDNISYIYGIGWSDDNTNIYTETENPNIGGQYSKNIPSDTPSSADILKVIPGSPEGKGVIYRMIDEFGNDCPYDFKNIQFYRKWNSSKSMWCDSGTSDDGVAAYTFSSIGTSSTTSFTDYSLNGFDNLVYSNIIKGKIYNNNQELNNICFFGNDCYSNTFGNSCYNNTFDYDCINNAFDNSCYNNTFGYGCSNNTFGNYCTNNTFDYGCKNNIFDKFCQNNIFSINSANNVFGNYCRNNEFAINCIGNVFGKYCIGNVFGIYCSGNEFGSYCQYNTFSSSSDGTTFGNYFQYNTIESGVKYCILYNTATASSSNVVKNYHIKSSIVGSLSAKIAIEATRNLNYDTTVAIDSNGVLKQYCEADLVSRVQQDDEIWYTTTDDNIINPSHNTGYNTGKFLDTNGNELQLISNTYINGQGCWKFNGKVNNIDIVHMFSYFPLCDMTTLKTFSLPKTFTGKFLSVARCENITKFIINNPIIDLKSDVHTIANYWDNVPNLHIYYNGTLAQWNNVPKGNFENYSGSNIPVHCTDGDTTWIIQAD